MADINKRAPGCDDDCEGERGERGERGKRGHRGHDGKDGHDGHDGHDGKDGHDGRDGDTGPTGPTGPTGSTGPTGPTGPSELSIEGNGAPLPGAPFDTLDFVGSGVEVLNAGGGEGTVVVAGQNLIFRPGGVQHANVYTSWTDLMAAKALIEGYKTIQFDDTIVTPCVIPAGSWDMHQVEWFAPYDDSSVNPSLILVQVTISDGATFPNLRKIGGNVNVTSLNNLPNPAAVVVPSSGAAGSRVFFEIATSLGGFPNLNNSGTAPFFDCTALIAGEFFLIRGQGQISGTGSPAVEFGASPATLAVTQQEMRIAAGHLSGSNSAAFMNVSLGGSGLNRQNNWAGTIRRGAPNNLFASVGGNGTGSIPYTRTTPFPASVNQAPPVPATTPLTFGGTTYVPGSTGGAGMNTTLMFNASGLGNIAQNLPLIRAASPALGAQNPTAGVLDSTGMIVIIKEVSSAGTVTVSPDPGGDMIEGGLGAVVVPAGGSRIFQSDGVGNWLIVGGYL